MIFRNKYHAIWSICKQNPPNTFEMCIKTWQQKFQLSRFADTDTKIKALVMNLA